MNSIRSPKLIGSCIHTQGPPTGKLQTRPTIHGAQREAVLSKGLMGNLKFYQRAKILTFPFDLNWLT